MRSVFSFLLAAGLTLAGCMSCKLLHHPVENRGDVFLWQDISPDTIKVLGYQDPLPSRYRTLLLNTGKMRAILDKLVEDSRLNPSSSLVVDLPLPEQGFASFRLMEQNTLSPALLQQYPRLRTYGGQGVSKPTSTVKLDFLPGGFHAYLSTEQGAIIIQPFSLGDSLHYLCFYRQHSGRVKENFEIQADSITNNR